MSTPQVAYLAILSACILASGFFSGSETALIGIARERVHQLAGSRRGRRLAELVSDPEAMLSTLLLANNFVNILGASAATALFIDLLGEQWGPWVATGAVTAVILVVGEITPKSLATRYTEQFALRVAPTIWQLSKVLRPIARVFQIAARGLFRLFRLDPDRAQPGITEEDIRTMAVLGEAEGEIESAEREIIHALFSLADRPVREVMTPRVDIVSVSWPTTMEDLRAAVAATGHSRFPVVEFELDHMLGILHVKDLLRLPHPEAHDIKRLLREPHYVPENKPILELLQEMRRRRFAFAVVLDEHGGVEGLVTVKDLVSELVGEMQDEFDPGAPSIVRIGPSQWVADGRLPLEELSETLAVELPEGTFTTAGGLFLHLAGRIPAEGDSVQTNGLLLTVMNMERRRIDRLKIEGVPATTGGGGPIS